MVDVLSPSTMLTHNATPVEHVLFINIKALHETHCFLIIIYLTCSWSSICVCLGLLTMVYV